MKNIMKIVLLGLVWNFAGVGQADLPAPSFRYYGTVRNEYGWPVTREEGLTLELRAGDRLIDRKTVVARAGSGVNFVLEAPVDAGGGEKRYADFAVRSREDVTVSALDGDEPVPVMRADVLPPVGAPGDAVRVNIQLGVDSCGDGLPDRWKELIVNANPHDDIRTIADVKPDDDFDGDGVSNADEFRAGTSPVFAGDVFQVLDFMKTDSGLLGLWFTTNRGFTYRVAAAETFDGGWEPVPFRLSPGGAEMAGYMEETGGARYFYVEFSEQMRFFRLEQL